MKRRIMKRAAATLVAAARVRWLQAQGKWHHLRERFGSARTVRLANVAEGTHAGNITRAADAAITERWLLGKAGSAADRVAICGAADSPLGVITDEASAAGELVNVALLGSMNGTTLMVASSGIALGALVEPAANGRVQTLGGLPGTHHVVGRALTAATAAGDLIEVDPVYFLRII